MGKKPQRHDWPEAKKLCRLNQHDIAMAKALGFHPDALIRARPDPKQKWKLPVKDWIHELHFKRFGKVLGEEPLPVAVPERMEPEDLEKLARDFWEQEFWEDYHERNSEEPPKKRKPKGTGGTAAIVPRTPIQPVTDIEPLTDFEPVTDRDVPF